MKKLLYISLLLLGTLTVNGQNLKDTIISIPFLNLSYSPQLTGGDFGKRFGFTNSVGLNFGIKTAKNWQFEVEGTFLFGNSIKEDSLLDFLKTDEGYIIDQYGDATNILMFQRGFTESILIGKLFPIIGPNKNSGIVTKFGIGFMHHKIRIQNQDDLVPALTKENVIYVDRLTMGLSLKQYIGYQHLSDRKLVNFNIGIELTEGFTKGMRDYQFGYGSYHDKRNEFLIGIRAGWIFPIYRKTPEDFYLD